MLVRYGAWVTLHHGCASNSGWYGDTCIMACASRYVGNGGSHCGLRDVGHGVLYVVTLRCVTAVRYGALRVCDGELCQSMFEVRVTFSYNNWKKPLMWIS